MQCSWVKILYDENACEWKVIPLHLIFITFGQNFNFHSNLPYDAQLPVFPYFIEIFFTTGANTLLFPQSSPLYFILFFMVQQTYLNQEQANIFFQ